MTPSPLALYTQAGHSCSRRIIRAYSSSFSLASLLLSTPVQRDIEALYALVRIADELVDGVGAEAGLTPEHILTALTHYEQQTVEALTTGFSTDPIIHTFATMARRCTIPVEYIEAFFASMRDDIPCSEASTSSQPTTHSSPTKVPTSHPGSAFPISHPGAAAPIPHPGSAPHTEAHQAAATPSHPASDSQPSPHTYSATDLERYIYGSAEVIGLMCLAIFLTHDPLPLPHDQEQLRAQAARKLGAAFQKINFLRDFADDAHRLHRYYMTSGPLTETTKAAIVRTIREDLACAQHGLPLLPPSSRRGVHAAYDLFVELTDQLDKTPADTIAHQRMRVTTPRKAILAARTLWRERR